MMPAISTTSNRFQAISGSWPLRLESLLAICAASMEPATISTPYQ